MQTSLSRRRILAAGGVGATLSLAGCNSLDSQDFLGSDSGSSDATVTVFANLDQEALQSYQADSASRWSPARWTHRRPRRRPRRRRSN